MHPTPTVPRPPLTPGRLARFRSRFALAPRPLPRTSRRRAVRALAAFAAGVLGLNVGLALWLEAGPPRLCDPEYGKRVARLKARTAERPGRPLVVMLGSSRTAMGVCPAALPDEPGRPVLFNLSLAGAGPILELMTFRRALADGVRPDAVVVEYWPAFLREDGAYHEEARFVKSRLRPGDLPTVREYFREPAEVEETLWRRRLNPWYEHRKMLLNQALPRWLPNTQRSEAIWDRIDDWGWLPGHKGATPEQAEQMLAACGNYYIPLFRDYEVSAEADRALRALIAECRGLGIPVALLYLPEAAGFRTFMPPAVARLADDHLARVRAETGVPLIDCRDWAPDADLPDGFHLVQPAAADFTRRLAPAVEATFPTLRSPRP